MFMVALQFAVCKDSAFLFFSVQHTSPICMCGCRTLVHLPCLTEKRGTTVTHKLQARLFSPASKIGKTMTLGLVCKCFIQLDLKNVQDGN